MYKAGRDPGPYHSDPQYSMSTEASVAFAAVAREDRLDSDRWKVAFVGQHFTRYYTQ